MDIKHTTIKLPKKNGAQLKAKVLVQGDDVVIVIPFPGRPDNAKHCQYVIEANGLSLNPATV